MPFPSFSEFFRVFAVLQPETHSSRENLDFYLYLCTDLINNSLNFLIMPNNHSAFKRSELAQCYFPDLKPMSAWEKFKDWMDASARLRPLLSLTRRTYTPAEVQLIYDVLGEP